MEVMKTEPAPARQPTSSQTRRVVMVVLLALPLLIYLTVYSIDARLNRGVIERHYGWQIWHTMSNELPEAAFPGLLKVSFWVLIFIFIAGFLAMLWFSLMSPAEGIVASGEELERSGTPAMTTEHAS